VEGKPVALFHKASGSYLKNVLDIVDRAHPRYIDMIYSRIPSLPDEIKTTNHPPLGAMIDDHQAGILMANLIQLGRNSIQMAEGELLAHMLRDGNAGNTFFLRYTPDEKMAVMKEWKIPDEQREAMCGELTSLLEFKQRCVGNTTAMKKRVSELKAVRAAEVPDDRKAEYWTGQRIDELDPTEFWNEERAEAFTPREFIDLRAQICTRWGKMSKAERDIYTPVLYDVSGRHMLAVTEAYNAIRDVSDELMLLDRKNIALQHTDEIQHSVDPSSDGFVQQLRQTQQANTAFLASYDLCENWGQGTPEIALIEGAMRDAQERPHHLKAPGGQTELLGNMAGFYGNLVRHHRHGMPYQYNLNGFIDNVIEIDEVNHDLAREIWRGLRPEGLEKPDSVIPGSIQLVLTRDFLTDDGKRPVRDYPSVTIPLLTANAGRPIIADYATGLFTSTLPDDARTLDRYLTQDHIDELSQLPLEAARSLCHAFGAPDARQYLTRETPEGVRVLDSVREQPGLMNAIDPAVDPGASPDYTVNYMACIADDTHRARLAQVVDKPYQRAHANYYVNVTDEERATVGRPEFPQFLDQLENNNAGDGSNYMHIMNDEGDRPILASPAVTGLISADLRCLEPLLEIIAHRKLTALGPTITNPDNRDFFSYDNLVNMAERAGDDAQWRIVENSLNYLGLP